MTDETKTPETPEPPAAAPEKPAAPAKAAAPAAPKAPPGPKKWEPSGTVVDNPAAAALRERFGEAVQGVPSPCGEATVLVEKGILPEALAFLRDDPRTAMDYLSDLTAAHYPANDRKFEVVYHLYSLEKKHALRVKVKLDDGEPCPTATKVWPGADWMEREAHDMFGIVFEGHPNLEVILLPEDFEGHPLRKEYPLGGDQEEMIRGNRYGKPVYLPDDLDEARKILEEERHGR
ncbi:MAG: NADH-quinone oxidoreductase subunit C [Acidobacteriota bacterium]